LTGCFCQAKISYQAKIMKTRREITDSLGIKSLNALNLPKALLIIPDGNGRWAKQMGVETNEGHEAGGSTLTRLLEAFVQLNTKIIGVWGFSEDNWKRDREEVDNIMAIIKKTTQENLDKMQKLGVKFMVVGSSERIGKEYPQVHQVLENAQQLTAKNTNKTFAIFLDYGERYQLEEFAKARESNPSLSTQELLAKINKGLPMFDMILRTSGEQRTSGFGPLASLAEFVSVEKNFPDLEASDIAWALQEYSKRQRRFGGR
jgi:undecaprenyl diphosphate synthase